ncbi:DNA-directed RNA polymerase subunit H [Methanohalophilus levihalophilus]|uniref:DNA-directed RNA polymerase subunit H n=1 Tax=Methanohalophilus levihalophilus TaxID=1431282 RepID=UPI001AE7F898|nr:DNA-directed RNA polymerase subunit H [Methanohalophilus levihalophilus]MBP2030473.1 DNA-directed RNA polymerase subunit H [Methanohalophilus levihalophilus]
MSTFSLLDHELIPHHEIADEDELKSVLKHYSIGREDLPKIKAADPVVKEIGAEVGDVVKITRKSETAGEAMYYRYVID